MENVGCVSGEFAGLRVDFCSTNSSIVSPHTIYCKRHSVRCEDLDRPPHLTLFSLGWPPYCSESQVEAVFSRVGTVTRIYLQQCVGQAAVEEMAHCTERTGMVAYVVFSQPEELEHALELCRIGEVVRCEVGRIGVRKWCEDYASARPVPASLDAAVRKVVGQYDRDTALQRTGRKQLSQPDSDGWVTVMSKRPQASIQHKTCRKKKKKKLLNLYQFQERESKREAIAELRRKFQKDKERVAELKARRRFRPF